MGRGGQQEPQPVPPPAPAGEGAQHGPSFPGTLLPAPSQPLPGWPCVDRDPGCRLLPFPPRGACLDHIAGAVASPTRQ
eukprot:CAMPEP_0117653550 /NCGR_PEP_ID=MMETSP0804-20121206/3252_1 /TAXON_ID=1074897 /ORGANISM="Tetraselmis astigmatica, Strain CCMP880" /LENGTH=77 /DNA_ID=CAMNT_0005459735 /DNA_START=185 /DNA_END=418 /DNA_ORIENTATION=+